MKTSTFLTLAAAALLVATPACKKKKAETQSAPAAASPDNPRPEPRKGGEHSGHTQGKRAHAGHDHASHDHAMPGHPRHGEARPGARGAALAQVTVPPKGKKFDPPIQKAQVPPGAWYCDMGTVHYARMEKGDGKCPLCHMKLKQKPAK